MNFACVCYGIKYKLEYAQKLYNMVQRNTTIDHKFYVFTDHPNPQQILDGDIFIKQFPRYDLQGCLLYTSPSPRDDELSRMPSSA